MQCKNNEQIIECIKNGDNELLIQLIMNRKDEYYRLAYIYMGNKEDALDALQDMIVKVFQNISKLKDHNAFQSWSKTILVNCCKRMLKKRSRVLYLYKQNEEYSKNNNSYKKIDIERAVEKLKPKQKEAIKLRYFTDMSYENISQITQIPIGTVKSRISNGLKNLKKIMGCDYCE